jgi:hypothetical protein
VETNTKKTACEEKKCQKSPGFGCNSFIFRAFPKEPSAVLTNNCENFIFLTFELSFRQGSHLERQKPAFRLSNPPSSLLFCQVFKHSNFKPLR